MEYYDLVLGSIPASFVGVTGALGTMGVDLAIAIPSAAILSLGVILHALFVRAPTESTSRHQSAATPPQGRSGSAN